MSEIVLYAGLFIFALGGIGLLVSAFRTGFGWGLSVVLLPPAAIAYLLAHWKSAKGPFKLQLFGAFIVAGILFVDGGVPSVTTEYPDFSSAGYSHPERFEYSEPLVSNQRFSCDGRTYCSQMTSCAEATYFLRNCPNPKMDGNGDGVPCERQWCN